MVVTFNLLSLPSDLINAVSKHWYNPDYNLVTIKLDESMGHATDSTCYRAAQLFHAICLQGYMLKVLPHKAGGWIPSRINPMTVEWTKKLIDH